MATRRRTREKLIFGLCGAVLPASPLIYKLQAREALADNVARGTVVDVSKLRARDSLRAARITGKAACIETFARQGPPSHAHVHCPSPPPMQIGGDNPTPRFLVRGLAQRHLSVSELVSLDAAKRPASLIRHPVCAAAPTACLIVTDRPGRVSASALSSQTRGSRPTSSHEATSPMSVPLDYRA